MVKKISILGSTGSIGTNTLDIIQKNPDRFQIVGLAAGKNIQLLKEQIQIFKPQIVSVCEKQHAKEIQSWIKNQKNLLPIQVNFGMAGACEVACATENDMVIGAMVGAIGLKPTLEAVKKGIDIGLANKETMVIAGALINEEAKKSGAKILPVDSEHNALFQVIDGRNPSEIKRLILTASGGPFFKKSRSELKNVTPKEALKHPNWDMGAKITIDSATMMNKGLEVIEAHFLFNMPANKIDILVHPQSIVHSLVEYQDGSVLAQLGIPDMRIPIGYALSYPQRILNDLPSLDLIQAKKLEFYEPDRDKFPAINLAYQALQLGKTMPTVLNAANEVAIPYFLNGKIPFVQIPQIVETVMEVHEKEGLQDQNSLENLLKIDHWARKTCEKLIGQ